MERSYFTPFPLIKSSTIRSEILYPPDVDQFLLYFIFIAGRKVTFDWHSTFLKFLHCPPPPPSQIMYLENTRLGLFSCIMKYKDVLIISEVRIKINFAKRVEFSEQGIILFLRNTVNSNQF